MDKNEVVDLKGNDGNVYRAIKRSYDSISAYNAMDGLNKTKVPRCYYELEDGRIAEPNRFGEFQIRGTNITLRPL